MKFFIRQPRWHDRVVLLAKHKVSAYNRIYFDAPSLPGEFWIGESTIRQSPLESNGVIQCYAVRLSDLNQWPGDEIVADQIKQVAKE